MQDTSISIIYEPFDSLLSSSATSLSPQDQQFANDLMQKLNALTAEQDKIEARVSKLQNVSTKWSDEEHQLFLRALRTLPFSDAAGISNVVKTKNAKQVATHVSKYLQKLEKAYAAEYKLEQLHELFVQAMLYLKNSDVTIISSTVNLLKKFNTAHVIDDPENICEHKKCIFSQFINEMPQASQITFKFIPVVLAAENLQIAVSFLAQKFNLLPEQITTAVVAVFMGKKGFRLDSGSHGLELHQEVK
ncbi:Myb-like_DNA-binding domain-containing protein [Hexamita inflata]|uniref:Myb-like_DNA-binding domain-containing protein n=1 Tax=Hexamita inflata TaxID=28002 RepID=A0ABP1GSV2_9EUKA